MKSVITKTLLVYCSARDYLRAVASLHHLNWSLSHDACELTCAKRHFYHFSCAKTEISPLNNKETRFSAIAAPHVL